ncbi:MAG: class II glutamine amidotransferase, partial [Thermodesulfovibrionales bacterium]|nr:class II glutamine amidotransferase [Thermodesulfovibrionales bacterium]
MCELLGMCFNKEVTPSISFRGFRQKGKLNYHGWGIAFYCDTAAAVYKEPLEANQSKLSEFLKDYQEIKSNIFIGHVRFASSGVKAYKNTHPFQRELNGRDFVFAHNGTLRGYRDRLKLGRFRPIGDTDSEYAFCYMLEMIEQEGIEFEGKKYFDLVARLIIEINKFGTFNCLLSDGKHLFCYHDKDGYNGLSFVERKAPFPEIKLKDEDWHINLAEVKDIDQRGFIIATQPLTDEHWERFKPGELKVFRKDK